MAPPQKHDNAMSGWPKHMYVDENENGAIRCLARGCGHTFTTNESMERQVAHYTEFELNPPIINIQFQHMGNQSGPSRTDMCKNDHGLLKQMHTLKVCLVCRLVLPDSRDLFNHIIEKHSGEMEISTIPGFLVHVRQFAEGIPNGVTHEVQYRNATFKLAFEHLIIQLKGHMQWKDTKFLLLGCPHGQEPSYDRLRQFFTKPVPDNQYMPVHPSEFLSNTHHPTFAVHPDYRWILSGLINALQHLYRIGVI